MTSPLKKIIQIIPEIKDGLFKGIAVGVVYEFVKFIPLILIKIIVDTLVAGQDSLTKVLYFIGAILVSYLVMNLIDYFAKKAHFRLMVEYETTLLKKAKQKLLSLHLGYHETFNTGAQTAKITKGSQKLMELLWFSFEEFIPTMIQLVITLILLFYEQWILGLIFAVSMPVTLGITLYSAKRAQPFRVKHHQKYDDAIGELGESIFNISTVKDYVQEEHQFQKFNHILADYAKLCNQRWAITTKILIWRDFSITVGRAVTLAVAVYLVMRGTLSAGSLVLIYSLTERAFLGTYRIGRLYNYLEDAMESIDRLSKLLAEKPQLQDKEDSLPTPSFKGDIEFKYVIFAYGNNPAALYNLNLGIKSGQIVALVGKSGSGKSTIAKLLLRNYDVTKGGIFVDGKNIKDYRIQNYKTRIAIVSQNVEIFNRTIMENILFANPSATKNQAIIAAKKAYAHEFITTFPKKYDTIVGEKGVRLSGGQKQRISIARALLKNPDIYIFDEATSSLDSESERYIQESIFSISKKKTTIIIAHRLSTIRHADKIVVLDKGRIVEVGTYQELVRKRGHFARMLEMQNVSELRE